jgi:hypothetical protein
VLSDPRRPPPLPFSNPNAFEGNKCTLNYAVCTNNFEQQFIALFLIGSTPNGAVAPDAVWVAFFTPSCREAVEVLGHDVRHVGNITIVGQRLPGKSS